MHSSGQMAAEQLNHPHRQVLEAAARRASQEQEEDEVAVAQCSPSLFPSPSLFRPVFVRLFFRSGERSFTQR